MTHYDIHYDLTNTKQADDKAIEDIYQWLGSKKKFNKVADAMLAVIQHNQVKNSPLKVSINQFRLYMSFAGVTGYPAMAMYRYLLHRRVKLLNDHGIEIATGRVYTITRHVIKLVAHGYGELKDYSTEMI